MNQAITLIAPIAPFRGGIARHSGCLAQALSARADVDLEIESFARLYPAWLYPGETDRDPQAAADTGLAAHFTLDTLNPLSWRRVVARILRRPGGALVIVPAWTFFTAPCLGWIARRLRKRGCKVAMVVHNVADHEGAGWKARLSDWQLAGADMFVTHGENLAGQLRARGFALPIRIVAHPAYSDFPAGEGTLPREKALELLCFGLVRDYKGVDTALRALARSGLDNVRLTIVGEVWEGRETIEALVRSAELAGKVELVDRYVSDQDAAEYFTRCDAVLAPYRSVTGSGVLAMATHYRRPVVASALQGLVEHVDDTKTGWLFPAGDEAALAALLKEKITRTATSAMDDALAERVRNDTGWENYAAALLDLAGIAPKRR